VSRPAIWRFGGVLGTLCSVEEESGIYREEVLLMIGALADIATDTRRILAILGDEEDEDEETQDDA
jgi:hypothetical protein